VPRHVSELTLSVLYLVLFAVMIAKGTVSGFVTFMCVIGLFVFVIRGTRASIQIWRSRNST
jgi:hypothetical protein